MPPRKAKSNGRQAVRNNSGGFPAWGWALVGIVVGVGLMALLMHRSLLPMAPQIAPQANPQATARSPSEPGVAESSEGAVAADKPKKPQYDFYSVLSEKDVRIPDAELKAQVRAEQQQQSEQQQQKPPASVTMPPAPSAAPAKAPAAVSQTITAAPAAAAAPTATGASAGGYMLQVGAFPNGGDAETLKAKLAMQGFVANVQNVSVNSQVFHRVRLGPFGSATQLEAVRQRLSAAGIHAIALKEGK